jgi:nicotinate-nucleotide adenylyltransferase
MTQGKSAEKTLVLFPGVFDPVNDGELLALRTVLLRLKAEKGVFLPSSSPKSAIASLSDRVSLLKAATGREKRFSVDLTYAESGSLLKTVRSFQERYPKKRIVLLFGFRSLDSLLSYPKIGKIALTVPIAVYAPKDYPKDHPAIRKLSLTLIPGPYRFVTSEEIRSGKKLAAPLPVLEEIAAKELYFLPSVKSYLHPHRYLHSLSVAKTAAEIARRNHLDPEKAYQAGLFHDIGKDLPAEEQRRIVEENYASFLPLPDFALHPFVSCYLARTVFGIDDEEILSAMEYHCTGRDGMSPLEKVIYAADKCEPTRAYPTLSMRKACLRDIQEGFLEVLREHASYFEKAGTDFLENGLSKKMYADYLKIKEK